MMIAMITQFNGDELDALMGLPLPARVMYLTGIRPYMDYESGVVGIKRGVSLRGLLEVLYVDPHQGMKSQSYSRDQVYRLIGWLEKAGLVERRSIEREKLIFFLPLADRGFQVKKKAATKPRQSRDRETATDGTSKLEGLEGNSETGAQQPDEVKAATPQITVISNKKDTTNVVSKKSKLIDDLLFEYGIDGQLAIDFIGHRKSKKAAITKTAMDGIKRESEKAGISVADASRMIIERNWQGFKADWVNATPPKRKKDFSERKEHKYIPRCQANAIDSTAEVIHEPARL